jgi:hypothetical protein
VFLLNRSTDEARAECRRALAEDERACSRGELFTILSLVGMHDEARRQAKVFRESPSGSTTWDAWTPLVRRVTAHAYEEVPMDPETEAGEAALMRLAVYENLGYAELGKGNREAACRWLRKAADLDPPNTDSALFGAVRERILRDPRWPPWLAEKQK